MSSYSIKSSLLLIFITLLLLLSLFSVCSASPSSFQSICYPQTNPFLLDLQLQCPNDIVSCSPIEMDGESLDNLLSSSKTNTYTSILFYASWCSFSKFVQPKFDALALMYPQIKHVKVEQSSALPSLFSRHGIHSVPSIVITNKSARVHYHGPKDLHSLMEFYQKITGLKHAMNITVDDVQQDSSSENNPGALRSLKDEPYLVFSLLFVLLKALLFLCPNIVSNVIALWVTYIPRLNLAIFGESKQLLAHALQLFDVKSALSKLKFSKSRNFHHGARSARVLASSLASVSLGESSSARE